MANINEQLGAAAAHAQVPLHYLRAPPTFHRGQDFNLWFRRFQAYCNAVNVPARDQPNFLISLLSDRVLGSVERYINPALTLEQLCAYIRRSEGWDQENAESFASELRYRKRTCNESIVDFYSELHRIGVRAYPREAQEYIRNAAIRESFLANLGHPHLSARLREHPEMEMEDLLSLATLLHEYCSAYT